ncbi:MAG: DUF1684 domain-containing protein [Candidatus Eisenbacteria bacterium]
MSRPPILLAIAAGLVAAGALAAGCAKKVVDLTQPVAVARPEAANEATRTMWRSQFLGDQQKWKDEFQGEFSPLPEDRRATAEGPTFYPFAVEWRLSGDLQRLTVQKFDRMPATRGKTQDYLEYGKIPVTSNGDTVTLMVYRPLDHPEQFFIPFHDATNGSETYAGGRYVHLDSLDVHRWVLDFNKAYNPYCAYDSVWICPLPPPSNTLPFPVRAGMLAK